MSARSRSVGVLAPPGNEIWPLWCSTSSERTVNSTCGSPRVVVQRQQHGSARQAGSSMYVGCMRPAGRGCVRSRRHCRRTACQSSEARLLRAASVLMQTFASLRMTSALRASASGSCPEHRHGAALRVGAEVRVDLRAHGAQRRERRIIGRRLDDGRELTRSRRAARRSRRRSAERRRIRVGGGSAAMRVAAGAARVVADRRPRAPTPSRRAARAASRCASTRSGTAVSTVALRRCRTAA